MRLTVCLATARGITRTRAELASTAAERARGLMAHAPLGPDEGMFFVFPTRDAWPFHMRDVPFALDLIFITRGLVIGHATGRPRDPTTLVGPGAYDAVLEVPAGFVAHHDVRLGDRVALDFSSYN